LANGDIIGGKANTAIGYWRSSFKTGKPTISFGILVFQQWLLRRYIITHHMLVWKVY